MLLVPRRPGVVDDDDGAAVSSGFPLVSRCPFAVSVTGVLIAGGARLRFLV